MEPETKHESEGTNVCRSLACWPVIIFAIFAIISLLGILFSTNVDSNTKAWSFFATLIFSLIWGAILWFFCRSGHHAISWFLLLLPLAVSIFWYVSVFLASATTAEQCVARGSMNDRANPLM